MNGQPQAFVPGHLLEQYEVREVRGSSEVGIEYLAHDFGAGLEVAILEFLPGSVSVRRGDCAVEPILPQNASQFDTMLEAFLAEATALSQCESPHINAIQRTFRANGTGYVVAESPSGIALEAVLGRERAIGGEVLGLMLPTLLDGLGKLHDSGLLHLDLRPANIMLRDDGSAVLRGFGAVPMSLGSPRQAFGGARWKRHVALAQSEYAPIELYSDNTAPGPWSDIYALGATLYRCVTGSPPPPVTDRILADSLELPSGRAAGGVDARSLAAIKAALAIVPTERPRSVSAWKNQFFGAPQTAPHSAASARFARTSARGGRLAVKADGPKRVGGAGVGGARDNGARSGAFKWSVPALALTAATAAIAFIDVGVLRPEGELLDREPGLEHLSMAGRTEAATYAVPAAAVNEPQAGGLGEPPAAAGAALVVDTVPPNVEVLVAGRTMGRTPLRLSGLPDGVHDVTLRHPHYETVELAGQEFSASQELRIATTLERGTGNLLITTDPPGAWVEVDGERVVASTPGRVSLPAGPVDIQIGAPGRSVARLAADVPMGGTGYIARILPVAFGTLELELEPADAAVVISNDAYIDYSYDPGMRLPQGAYVLEVSKPGYREVNQTVNVDGETSVRIELLPRS